jgi:SAM-dependent methyltransferase
MQAYGQDFARIYNQRWPEFANRVAPEILKFYESTPSGGSEKTLLDLCCGAGHLSRYFLDNGFRVVGIDLSEHMLRYACDNAGEYLKSEKAKFIKADASDFALDERFGLVVSMYDSLNHLEDEGALIRCFENVRAVCGGYFIFDLNTRHGLKRWSSEYIDDSDKDVLIIRRGEFDGVSDRARITITGFIREGNGLFKRFDETIFNTVFDMQWVKRALTDTGFRSVRFARLQDLSAPIDDPEQEGRAFIIAH